jgi:hypothetical protein
MRPKRAIFRADGRASSAGPVPEGRNASAVAAPVAARQHAVRPTLSAGDVLGLQRAVGNRATLHLIARHPVSETPLSTATIQRKVEADKLNVVGEHHDESGDRREVEKALLKSFGPYWEENQLTYEVGNQTRQGDNLELLVIHSLMILSSHMASLEWWVNNAVQVLDNNLYPLQDMVKKDVPTIKKRIDKALEETEELKLALNELDKSDWPDEALLNGATEVRMYFEESLEEYKDDIEDAEQKHEDMPDTLHNLLGSARAWRDGIAQLLATHGYDVKAVQPSPEEKKSANALLEKQVVGERSLHMWMSAVQAAEQGHVTGVWKVGEEHLADMLGETHAGVTLTTREEFNKDYFPSKATDKT